MPAIDPSIPLSIKPPDTLGTIGSIANTATALQSFQTGKLQQQRVNVQLQQEQGALDARRNIATVMSDPNIRDPDTGLPDLNKLWPALQGADPNGYLRDEVFGKIAKTNTDMKAVQQLGMQVGNEAQSYIGQRLGALASDPAVTKDQVNAALDDAVRVAGPGSPAVKPLVDIVRRNINGLDRPETLAPTLAKMRNMAFPVSVQAPQTTLVPTGGGVQPTQTNALNGPIAANGQPIAQPNEEIVTDNAGNKFKGTRDVNGRLSIAPLQASSAPGATAPMMTMPPGENQGSMQALTQARQETNNAAAKVPEQHFNNQQIVRLADQGFTGSTAPLAAKVFSSMGLQLIPGDEAANYQQLGHFMALQTQANAKAMGVQNIPGQLTAESASGSANWDAKAIKRATKVNDALATGVDLFNRGLENAINDPNNKNGIFAARQFQNAWSKTFDVNAMRWHNAIQNGDKEEQKAVLDSVGGKGSAGAAQLKAKLNALDALIGQ